MEENKKNTLKSIQKIIQSGELEFKESDFSDYSFKINSQKLLGNIEVYSLHIKKGDKKINPFSTFFISNNKEIGIGTKIINQTYNSLPENVVYECEYSTYLYGNGEIENSEDRKIYAKFGLNIDFLKKVDSNNKILKNRVLYCPERMILFPPVDKIEDLNLEHCLWNSEVLPVIKKELNKIILLNIEKEFYNLKKNPWYNVLYPK